MRAARLVLIVAVAAQWGCIGMSGKELQPVPPENRTDFSVSAGERVRLEVYAGDVRIEGVDGYDGFIGLTPRCREGSKKCRERVAGARLEPSTDAGTLRLTGNDAALAADAVRIEAGVPRNVPLDVQMKYGELTIARLHDALRVRMEAGDVHVSLPMDIVRSVRLSARFGDASLVVDGRTIEGRRRALVGATVDWGSESGVHDVVIQLRYGDVQVELY